MKRSQIGVGMALVSLLCALAHPAALFALGIRLPDQDAFATARGNAFAATADDPSAVYYNPAGITQLEGANLSLGMYGITMASRFNSTAGPSINSQQEWAALPQIFSTISFTNSHLTLGLGTYSPYGLSMEWPYNAPWVAHGLPRSGEIDYFRANPVLAWQPCDTFSIAAGAMLDYSEAELQLNPPGAQVRLRGRDDDAGFNLGLLWHPWQQHSFGVTYRSATDMDYQGHARTATALGAASQATSLNYHFPQTVTVGYSYRPTTNWNFEVDADWTDWTSLRTLTVVGTPLAYPFNWKPSTMYEFGATRFLGKGWRASAGYMFSENSVPSGFLNPLVPDSDRHLFSVGVGKSYSHLSWDAAYQLGYGPSRPVSGDPYTPNGNYEFFSNALSLNIGWHF